MTFNDFIDRSRLCWHWAHFAPTKPKTNCSWRYSIYILYIYITHLGHARDLCNLYADTWKGRRNEERGSSYQSSQLRRGVKFSTLRSFLMHISCGWQRNLFSSQRQRQPERQRERKNMYLFLWVPKLRLIIDQRACSGGLIVVGAKGFTIPDFRCPFPTFPFPCFLPLGLHWSWPVSLCVLRSVNCQSGPRPIPVWRYMTV